MPTFPRTLFFSVSCWFRGYERELREQFPDPPHSVFYGGLSRCDGGRDPLDAGTWKNPMIGKPAASYFQSVGDIGKPSVHRCFIEWFEAVDF